jgi:hypothetical protein
VAAGANYKAYDQHASGGGLNGLALFGLGRPLSWRVEPARQAGVADVVAALAVDAIAGIRPAVFETGHQLTTPPPSMCGNGC